jgi:2-polyprenyl-6-methoxyphenol hydroxylase-like FAD-dependent oxidoreductase
MSMQDTDVQVLIIGAGPVGLFLANECARRGLRWRIVEARSRQSVHSKALAVMPRTMEIFDMAGVADPFLQCANRVTQPSPSSRTGGRSPVCRSRPKTVRIDLWRWFRRT